jgi:hypothetical protein
MGDWAPGELDTERTATFDGIPLAGWTYRVGAFLIDWAASYVGASIAVVATGAVDGDVSTTYLVTWFVGFAVTWLAVTVLVSTQTGGQTLGKAVGGMRTVDTRTGRGVGLWVSLLRDGVLVLLYAIPFVFIVDATMPLGERRQSLRDRIAGTRVVEAATYRARRVALSVAGGLAAVLAIGIITATFVLGDGLRSSGTADAETGARLGNGWTTGAQRAFLDQCLDQGHTAGTCDCVFDQLTRHVAMDELSHGKPARDTMIRIDRAWETCGG